MKEKVERLLRLLKEESVVEKIRNATDPVEVYEKYEGHFLIEILEIQENFKNDEECDFEIIPEDALSWCIIFMMTKLNEEDFKIDHKILADALNEVEGDLEEVAHRMAKFVLTDVWTYYDDATELISKFFC